MNQWKITHPAETPFGECSNCKYEFNSELISEYEIKYCPNCGYKIGDSDIKVSLDSEYRLEILKKAFDMACHNLFCYSTNYAMTRPKEGYEENWRKEKKTVEVLEAWIKELKEAGASS